jgi:hypothetical protein
VASEKKAVTKNRQAASEGQAIGRGLKTTLIEGAYVEGAYVEGAYVEGAYVEGAYVVESDERAMC